MNIIKSIHIPKSDFKIWNNTFLVIEIHSWFFSKGISCVHELALVFISGGLTRYCRDRKKWFRSVFWDKLDFDAVSLGFLLDWNFLGVFELSLGLGVDFTWVDWYSFVLCFSVIGSASGSSFFSRLVKFSFKSFKVYRRSSIFKHVPINDDCLPTALTCF